MVDEASGDVYYCNRKTRKTTWDRPEGVEIDERKRTFPDKSGITTTASEEVVGTKEITETVVLAGVTSGLAHEDAPDPIGEALNVSEDFLQKRINGIFDALHDEDEISHDIQSTVSPPPKRSDESMLRTGEAGIYGTLYLSNGEAMRGRWKDGAFEPLDRSIANDRKDKGPTPVLVSSSKSSSSSSGHSGYEHADDELSAKDMKRVDVSARRPIDPSGFDRTDDPSACSTLEPSKRNLNDAMPAAADPDQSIEIAPIPERASVEDTFHQEDRDLEKGETESAMQRRRKRLREKRWWKCVPFLLVFLGAACLGAGVYTWYLFLGPGKQSANSTTSIGSSGSDPGGAFSGPTSVSSGEIDSSSRPRDDGSEDVI